MAKRLLFSCSDLSLVSHCQEKTHKSGRWLPYRESGFKWIGMRGKPDSLGHAFVEWIIRGLEQWLDQGYCLFILYLMTNKTMHQWLGRIKDFNNEATSQLIFTNLLKYHKLTFLLWVIQQQYKIVDDFSSFYDAVMPLFQKVFFDTFLGRNIVDQ